MSNYADNILDKDGNPIYLEDKHLNDQTSQTTVATTDAVMLKDTNGEYHSIAKASFNEAVRAAMGSILTNFDKGASIARIPGIDSNNDLGSVTSANLASVLNVAKIGNKILVNPGSENFNNDTYQEDAIVRVSDTSLVVGTLPPLSDSWMYLVNIISDQKDFRLQIAADSDSKWIREYWGSWRPWQRIDNFGCSTTSELASLLGGALLTRHTRLADFDLAVLKQAVADQNLEKYGLKVGDQKTINGHDYIIAGLNCLKGTHSYTCTSNHVGLIVIPHTTQAWNASGNTSTGADNRGAGYKNCDLHYYLENTLLPLVEADLGAGNLLRHYKLLSNAINTSGYNRYGEATGCSSGGDWEADCKICALSEAQVYGATVWSSSGFDTGEAAQQLEVFQHFNKNEIFGNEYPWLRDVVSSSHAADVNYSGGAGRDAVSIARYVAALILFH